MTETFLNFEGKIDAATFGELCSQRDSNTVHVVI